MLEFQEGFFEQEVRDGFYLDTTMKTLWAAELEVLQKVAEVCDRHGLKWYAAYGTLLGAIRHEGFVPWDDDMDIWLKRPDYNILMQVLPKELPEGYLVRGPLTDEGYDQYHTCLNSGNGISIAKEWLEQYHGCPFTVGLDIFPLDFLPRDEKERELQVNLLTMAGRIAQLAKNVGRGDYDSEDSDVGAGNLEASGLKASNLEISGLEAGSLEVSVLKASESRDGVDGQDKELTLKESVIEEIKLGVGYLEENCKLQIDHQLLEDGEWYKVSSELWKWANYLAMMYSEKESDYLVEFFDYIQCPRKKYPKEWFGDGYSATFENFMIPIPSGYDDILRYIYGHYLVCSRGGGTHEYPYYARQLRQLREYVKDIEQRAQKVGWISIDEVEVEEESRELPKEWIPLTLSLNGDRKKIILCANDPNVYVKYGDKALDGLEKNFEVFEKAKDDVTLWWRPHPVMKKVLDQVSSHLGDRYQQILESYKAAGWGICDETDNIERAVEAGDIYYGDLNAIIQPFQNALKPVVVTVADDGSECEKIVYDNNAGRRREYRTFIGASDYVEDAGRVYFANVNYNALVVVDKETQMVVEHIPFAETKRAIKNMHLQSVRLQNKIYFLPAEAPCLHIYDMESGKQKICRFLDEANAPKESWGHFLYGDKVFLLPCRADQNLWSIQPSSDAPVRESWWEIPGEEAVLKHGKMDENCFYTLAENSDRMYITNVTDKTIESLSFPDEQIINVVYDGENFWYTLNGTLDIVCWNQTTGVIDRYSLSQHIYPGYFNIVYAGMHFAAGNLFLVSADREFLYVLDKEKRQLRILYRIEEYKQWRGDFEFIPYYKQVGNSLVCMYRNTDIVLIVDLETLKVERWNKVIGMETFIEEDVYKYIYKILLEDNTYKSALLYEDKYGGNVDFLVQYCVENNVCES